MRHTTLALVAALLVAFPACGDGDDVGSGTPPQGATTVGTADPGTRSTEVPGAGSRLEVGGVLSERYCEVLTVRTTDDGLQAEVWGSQGVNDCPQEGFERIDADEAAGQVGAMGAIVNGPRFWLLDAIVANQMAGSGETRTFGGVEMRSIAVVELGAGDGLPSRAPFEEVSVVRDTLFIFDAGTEVYELTAPDGSVYVMQSYTVEVDPELTRADLAGLGDRLDLPEGWTFTSRVLDEELAVEDLDGIATVIQDELHNTYQLRSRP